jgi:hypothetical protein
MENRRGGRFSGCDQIQGLPGMGSDEEPEPILNNFRLNPQNTPRFARLVKP